MKQLILKTNVNGDCYQAPDYVEVTLNSADIERILELSNLAKTHNVYKMSEFSDVDNYYVVNEDGEYPELVEPEDIRLECVTLNMTRDDFYWSGYIKHTDDRWESDSVMITELDNQEPYNDFIREYKNQLEGV